jgi:hypothetical protein
MDRPFEALFTPKIVLSYAKFAFIVALQPIFIVWSNTAKFLLDKHLHRYLPGKWPYRADGEKSQAASGDGDVFSYELMDSSDALFLMRDVDCEKNRPTVVVRLKLSNAKVHADISIMIVTIRYTVLDLNKESRIYFLVWTLWRF